MLFYFTATGNSLYAARQIDKMPISIPQIIDNQEPVFEDEAIGIVCPIFGHEVPPMVEDFMRKSTFKTDYLYILLTYGNRHGGAAELAEQTAARYGLKPAYINTIRMVDNYLPAFDMDEQKKIDKKEDEQIAAVLSDINSRRHFIQPAMPEDRQAHQMYLERTAKLPPDTFKNLYRITDRCAGCGLCVSVCPAGCFRIENGKAVQDPELCQTCMACIHHCPHKAIQLNIPEMNPNARYRNEHIALSDIIAANNREQ